MSAAGRRKRLNVRRLAQEKGLDPEIVGSAVLGVDRASGRNAEFLKRRGLLDPDRLRAERALVQRIRARVGNNRPSPGGGTASSGLRARVYDRDGHRCVLCGSPDDLTLDHWIPRSKGGPTSFSNLRAMCSPCNRAKGSTLPGDLP